MGPALDPDPGASAAGASSTAPVSHARRSAGQCAASTRGWASMRSRRWMRSVTSPPQKGRTPRPRWKPGEPGEPGEPPRASPLLRALQATADDLNDAGQLCSVMPRTWPRGPRAGTTSQATRPGSRAAAHGTREVKPWGPASTQEAERRRAQVPEVQRRVNLATTHVGRAQGRSQREMTRLREGFSVHPQEVRWLGTYLCPGA